MSVDRRLGVTRSHAAENLKRNAIVTHQLTGVAQPAGFALNNEEPKRMCCFSNEHRPGQLRGSLAPALRPVEAVQRVKGRLQCATKAAKCRRLLLQELLLKQRSGILRRALADDGLSRMKWHRAANHIEK